MAEKQKQLQEEEEEVDEGQGGDSLMMGFNLLPEECILTILSFISPSPKDVIRLSLVSTTFKSASESDSVWENFIPSIYPEIISRSSSSSSSTATTTSTSILGGFSSKKDLCCSLFDKPIIIDGGSKSFGLEKRSGKICFMLGARAISIIGGNTPSYWTWRPSSESRFSEVAELLDVCWMEITGKVETRMLSPKTIYGAYFVIKTAEKNSGLDRYRGQFSVRFVRGGGECSKVRWVFLKGENRQQHQQQRKFTRERGDGWMEIEMGEFYNDGEEDGEVEMHLLETISRWKCGLIVEGMELRPKARSSWNASIGTLQGLEEWTVEKGGMPCLRELSTCTCRTILKMLPEGLRSVTTLTELEMIDMSTEFNERVKEGGSRRLVQNPTRNLRQNCNRWYDTDTIEKVAGVDPSTLIDV